MTNENEDNTAAVKICQDDKYKLISLFYLHIGAPPPEDWYGKGGTISRTVESLEMTIEERRKVETVISDTYQSLRQEKVFDEGRISQKNKTAIADGSKIQQLVADYRESGLSFSKTTFLINIYCVENDLLTIIRSAVVSCEQRMEKVVTSIAKRPQGSLDKNTTWAKLPPPHRPVSPPSPSTIWSAPPSCPLPTPPRLPRRRQWWRRPARSNPWPGSLPKFRISGAWERPMDAQMTDVPSLLSTRILSLRLFIMEVKVSDRPSKYTTRSIPCRTVMSKRDKVVASWRRSRGMNRGRSGPASAGITD